MYLPGGQFCCPSRIGSSLRRSGGNHCCPPKEAVDVIPRPQDMEVLLLPLSKPPTVSGKGLSWLLINPKWKHYPMRSIIIIFKNKKKKGSQPLMFLSWNNQAVCQVSLDPKWDTRYKRGGIPGIPK